MKKIKPLICILLVVVLLSGCSFQLASSTNDLISSLSPFGDNAKIKESLDSFLKDGYTLKNPTSGKYITSYSFFDLDNDKQDEAIVFYEPNNKLGSVKMSCLKLENEKWKVIDEIKGEGEDVYSLDFADVDNDGLIEILVCWNTISNSTNHTFNIYKISDKITKAVEDNKTINNYFVTDVNGDNKNEIVLFEIQSGNYSSAKAELVSVSNNKYRLLGETKLDSRVSTYTNISLENAEGYSRIYVDALNSNGDSMLTEIIYWSDSYGTIISPFYSYSSGTTSGTRRNCLVKSCDINGDENIEIPTDYKKNIKDLKFIDWKIYKNTILMHKNYSIFVQEDNYNVIIPDSYIDLIKANYDADNKELVVQDKETKTNVFSIKPVLKVVYDKEPIEGYQIILENSGYYYLAKCEDNQNIKITIDDLKQFIKTN